MLHPTLTNALQRPSKSNPHLFADMRSHRPSQHLTAQQSAAAPQLTEIHRLSACSCLWFRGKAGRESTLDGCRIGGGGLAGEVLAYERLRRALCTCSHASCVNMKSVHDAGVMNYFMHLYRV